MCPIIWKFHYSSEETKESCHQQCPTNSESKAYMCSVPFIQVSPHLSHIVILGGATNGHPAWHLFLTPNSVFTVRKCETLQEEARTLSRDLGHFRIKQVRHTDHVLWKYFTKCYLGGECINGSKTKCQTNIWNLQQQQKQSSLNKRVGLHTHIHIFFILIYILIYTFFHTHIHTHIHIFTLNTTQITV